MSSRKPKVDRSLVALRSLKAHHVLQPTPELPKEAPSVLYTIQSYHLPDGVREEAQTAKHLKPWVLTDMPHREIAPPPAVRYARVSIPRAVAERVRVGKPKAADVRKAVLHQRDESLALLTHMHTENHFHTEFSATPAELAGSGFAKDHHFYDNPENASRASNAAHATTIHGPDYMANFRKRHDLGLKAALLLEDKLKGDARRGLRWCKHCGQCSASTCHLVSQLNHFRKGLDHLEAMRRHRNQFLGYDPSDLTAPLRAPFSA